MASTTTPKMTAEEFFDWANQPENEDRRYELENGEVVEMPSPGELHGVVCWLVSMLVGNYLLRRGAGYICTNDTGLIVRRGPDTVRGPDVMAFAESKAISELNRGHCEHIPVLIVEVLSPSDTMRQTARRVRQYLARGIPLVWVIDPIERVVYVHTPNEYTKDLDETDELTGNGVLPDFRCRVADLFTLPGQSQAATNP
jgi:Uma2 family endonuclease